MRLFGLVLKGLLVLVPAIIIYGTEVNAFESISGVRDSLRIISLSDKNFQETIDRHE